VLHGFGGKGELTKGQLGPFEVLLRGVEGLWEGIRQTERGDTSARGAT